MILYKPRRGFSLAQFTSGPRITSNCLRLVSQYSSPLLSAQVPRRLFHVSLWRREGVSTAQTTTTLFIDDFKESLAFFRPTHQIAQLDDPNLQEQEVVLHGYRGESRNSSSKLSFVELYSPDLFHKVQIVSTRKGNSLKGPHETIKKAGEHTPLVVRGLLKRRLNANNSVDRTIKIVTKELHLSDVQVLNNFPKHPDTSQALAPERRFFQARDSYHLRDAIKFRAKVAEICRDWLQNKNGFTEIETPLLFKSTSEGAREFLVPTRRKGFAYALPQSPQQFKQMIMAMRFPRYFQIARCFRDEDHRADRQPEFTQLDMEISFVTGEEVMQCVESLIKALWVETSQPNLPEAFPRLTYQEAMSKYGSDKPDLRLDYQIYKIDHLLPVDLISKISPLNKPAVDVTILRTGKAVSDSALTRQFIKDFLDHPDRSMYNENPSGAPGIFVFGSTKPLQGLHPFGFEAAEEVERLLAPDEGDLVILQARPDTPQFSGGSTILGRLVLALHRAAVERQLIPPPCGFHPLWVTDFPLFTPTSSAADEPGQSGAAGLRSTHHPFASPKTPKDIDYLLTDPTQAIADHYDLVINGVELGGGSRRIHNAKMQRFIMTDVLKMPGAKVEEFNHLLIMLESGCPPHAGFALGFDRLIALMLGKQSVRDVIAFPKSGRGEDVMVGAPSRVSKRDWEAYGMMVKEDEEG